MRHPIGRIAGIALLAACVWTPATRAQSGTQSQPAPGAPADTSTKPKDPAASSTPKKVFTNDDLSGMQRGDVSVVGNNRGTGRSGPAAGGTKNQQYWHNRAQRIRDQMAEVDRQMELLTKPDPNTGASLPSSSTPPPGAHSTASRPTAQLQRLQSRKAQLQQEMDQLEDEARRAGVPPGWLR